MNPITTFLQSEQALKILGLPGLALLLAFVFYRGLVSARLVRPVGRNQSFVILLMIIGYFLIVSVLVIWVYRPAREAVASAAQPAAAKVEEPSAWSKIDSFFARTDLDTPLSTFDSALGPATADARVDREKPEPRKRNYFTLSDGVLVTVGHNAGAVQWIAAFDRSGKLRIPTMHMGQMQDDGTERNFERLSDFDLEFVADRCDGLDASSAGRNGIYAITPCYFGRPGSYNHFAFVFEASETQLPLMDGACSPLTQGAKLTVERVRQCQIGKEKPLGFIVASEEKELASAAPAFFETLDH